MLRSFWHDTKGATSIEYAVITGMVALAIVASATITGNALEGAYAAIRDAVSSVPSAPPG